MTRRLLLTVLAALAVPAAALGAAAWVHWEGNAFACFIPNTHWQVVEGPNGLTISSPVGDDVVEFAFATKVPGYASPEQIFAYLVQHGGVDLHPVTGLKVVRRSPVGSIPNGKRQVFEWTGTRHHRLGGTQRVHGFVIVDSLATPDGGYGWETYSEVSPLATWHKTFATLEYIRKHITFYGNG